MTHFWWVKIYILNIYFISKNPPKMTKRPKKKYLQMRLYSMSQSQQVRILCQHLTGRPWVYQMKTTALKRSKYFNFLTKYTGKAKYTRVSSKLRYLILCTLCSPQMDKYGRKLIIPLPCFKSWQKVEENVLTQRGPSNLWRIDGGEGVINMDITYSGALG